MNNLPPCPVCGGTMEYAGSLVLNNFKKIFRDRWRCTNCENTEWQDRTDWVMEMERWEPDLDKALADIKKAKDDMFKAITKLVRPVTSEEVINHK